MTIKHIDSDAKRSVIGSVNKEKGAYVIPFEPYDVQKKMSHTVKSCLESTSPPVPVAAVEVPTGCGKTLALLSSVLQYQLQLDKLTPLELEQHLRSRAWKPFSGPDEKTKPQTREENVHHDYYQPHENKEMDVNRNDNDSFNHVQSRCNDGSNVVVDSEDEWRVPPTFFKQFRAPGVKRLRVEMDHTSTDLRRQHDPPPCTVFYVTRTHAQVRQAVGELSKLRGLQRLKMNILGSRERYCINSTILKARANKTLPVEGINLGEVCDKLVSLGQCEAVHGYNALASKAIGFPICRNRSDKVWDMEDLVTEGVATQSCPYYAARDLVFYAHITFATYMYLLDPLIRHECKMEGALRNHSIIVFDEAHNVPLVCQDALSLETSTHTLQLILHELEPLIVSHSSHASLSSTSTSNMGTFTLAYPREFKLTHWTLGELFSLLFDIFSAIFRFVDDPTKCSASSGVSSDSTSHLFEKGNDESRGATIPGASLARVIQQCIKEYVPIVSGQHANSVGLAMFRQAYGIVMSLGVTFNPFQFSVFGLSVMKRWLLIMRFLIQKPSAFVFSIHEVPNRHTDGNLTHTQRSVGIRCLDGGLAFQHLLGGTHRIILASGTLAPFDQLARDVGLSPSQMLTFEGEHVVKTHQYRLSALTRMTDASRIRCTYANMKDSSFISRLATTIVSLVDQVPFGGVLVFLPNYHVMHSLASSLTALYNKENFNRDREKSIYRYKNNGSGGGGGGVEERKGSGRLPQIFVEPKAGDEFPALLDTFRAVTSRRTAILASVYRAKVSEGIDFADSMARLILCVGVPFQPLKSWTVGAQRHYSGEEWYLTDAIRSVNQALGRCLRHSRDYGAVVLLDDRFEHESHSGRLSKWCRSSMLLHESLPTLTEELATFFSCNTEVKKGENIQVKQEEQKSHVHPPSGNGKSSIVKPLLSYVNHHPKEIQRMRVTTCTHEWSCAAVKLLYEDHDAVEDVTAAELRQMIHQLEEEYPELEEQRPRLHV